MKESQIRFCAPDDFRIIMDTVDRNAAVFAPWLGPILRVYEATGCRPSEIAGCNERTMRGKGGRREVEVKEHHGLRARDVLSGNLLHVEGKNTNGGRGKAVALKPREVVCANEVVYRDLVERAQLAHPDEHLFGLGPHPQPSKDGYSRLWREVRKLKGLLPGNLQPFTVKWLRHSWAIYALRSGIDLVSVQRQLGHSDLETTAVYLRFAPADKDRIVRAFSHGQDAHITQHDCPACGFAWKVDVRTGAIDASDRAGAILKRRK